MLNIKLNCQVFEGIVIVWFVIFFIFLLYLYIKSFKPYKASFNEEYYTGIPDDLNLIEVSNLVNRKINANVLASYVISLINRGLLKIADIDGKEYITKGNSTGTKSVGDECTLKLILYTMGDGEKVTIDELYHFSDRKRNKKIMLMEYTIWDKVMKKENYQHIFYETKDQYGLVRAITIIGCSLFLVNIIAGFHSVLSYFTILPAILILLFFSQVYKRTRDANEEYLKWMAFKAYLENITSFDIKILYPEEYLMYGTCLGVRGLEAKITNHNYCERLIEALNRSVLKAVLNGNKIK
ncbi:MAG: DUF2207 domain-containing protein [Bacilli bacterium]